MRRLLRLGGVKETGRIGRRQRISGRGGYRRFRSRSIRLFFRRHGIRRHHGGSGKTFHSLCGCGRRCCSSGFFSGFHAGLRFFCSSFRFGLSLGGGFGLSLGFGFGFGKQCLLLGRESLESPGGFIGPLAGGREVCKGAIRLSFCAVGRCKRLILALALELGRIGELVLRDDVQILDQLDFGVGGAEFRTGAGVDDLVILFKDGEWIGERSDHRITVGLPVLAGENRVELNAHGVKKKGCRDGMPGSPCGYWALLRRNFV